jgi:hypothetical protein
MPPDHMFVTNYSNGEDLALEPSMYCAVAFYISNADDLTLETFIYLVVATWRSILHILNDGCKTRSEASRFHGSNDNCEAEERKLYC